MEFLVLLGLIGALVFAPVIVYYFLIRKSISDGIWTSLKVWLIGLGLSWVVPDSPVKYVLGLVSTFLVFKVWHKPKIGSNWLILKYYVFTVLLSVALAFLLLLGYVAFGLLKGDFGGLS